jgi:hypothetical protein
VPPTFAVPPTLACPKENAHNNGTIARERKIDFFMGILGENGRL